MGCTMTKASDNNNIKNGEVSRTTNVQDEARSFRSKIGAIKMLIRNNKSHQALLSYLTKINKSELLICYKDLDEVLLTSHDQMFNRIEGMVMRYKASYEEYMDTINDNRRNRNSKDMIYKLIWNTFGELRTVDISNLSYNELTRLITITQNDLLSKLVIPFEKFLVSNEYKQWQNEQIKDDRKQQKTRSKRGDTSISQNNSINNNNTIDNNATSNMSLASNSMKTYSDSHPSILIVDDSVVTLKLTGLTLEKDGHSVDRAENGRIALELLKQRHYDVVLIDLNMPILDGFETVHSFREYERLAAAEISGNNRKNGRVIRRGDSDMSSISNDSYTVDENNPFSNNITKFGTSEDKYVPYSQYSNQLIIGMSTNVDEETQRRAFQSGMDYFLPKPFTLQKFTETLRIAIEKRQNTDRTISKDVESVPKTPNILFES